MVNRAIQFGQPSKRKDFELYKATCLSYACDLHSLSFFENDEKLDALVYEFFEFLAEKEEI